MTIKEKAKQIHDDFWSVMSDNQYRPLSYADAKTCAKIAIKYLKDETESDSIQEYWNQVYEEIEKL